MILSGHSLLPFPKHAHSLTFVIFFVVFLYNDISIHASPNNNVWLYSFWNFERNQHVYILLCLASFTQCCFHNSSKLCVAVVHSFSLLYSILWIYMPQFFYSWWGIWVTLDNYEEFFHEPSVTCTVVYVYMIFSYDTYPGVEWPDHRV